MASNGVKYLVLFLLIATATYVNAQTVKLAGVVINGDERVGGALIKNINNHNQTLSDERGQFEIAANKGDTLIISKVNYANDTLLTQDELSIFVSLKKPATMLNEVDINSTPINPESVYAANKKEYKIIYFWGDKSNIFGVSTGIGNIAGVTVNIDKLNNALGKRGRDARKLQRTFTIDYRNSIVDKRFNPIAARITGYKGEQLSDFIGDNRPSYEMVSKSSDYDLINYIKRRIQENRKNHGNRQNH